MIRLLFSPIRWLLRILILLIAVGILGVYVYLYFIGGIVEKKLTKQTGFTTKVGSLEVSLLKTNMNLLDLEIQSPLRFPDKRFLKVSRFKADFRPMSLIFGKQKAYHEVLLYIDDLTLVQNAAGELNFRSFMQVLHADEESHGDLSRSKDNQFFDTEKLEIRIGTLRSLSFAEGKNQEKIIGNHVEIMLEDVRSRDVVLTELERKLGKEGAVIVGDLLWESLHQANKLIGGMSGMWDWVYERGGKLKEFGEETLDNFPNLIEEKGK